MLSGPKAVRTIIALHFYFVILGFAFNVTATELGEQHHVMGKVQKCHQKFVDLDGMRFVIHKSTKTYSQAHEQIEISRIHRGQLVDITYYKVGKYNVVEKIKLLDLVGTGNYKTFAGPIQQSSLNAIYINNKRFVIDDFTIKLGLNLQKSNQLFWKNMYVTIIALKNDQGDWIAEIVRENTKKRRRPTYYSNMAE